MKNELLIIREFDAPRALVFEAFTQAEHLQHWWGPAGFALKVIHLEVKPGGTFHFQMTSAEGYVMYGVFHYKEINSPSKIVFTNSFADPSGQIIVPPFDASFPKEVLYTWTFEERNGRTTLTMKGEALTDNQESIQSYLNLKDDMNEGFGKTFDQLDDYISSIVVH